MSNLGDRCGLMAIPDIRFPVCYDEHNRGILFLNILQVKRYSSRNWFKDITLRQHIMSSNLGSVLRVLKK